MDTQDHNTYEEQPIETNASLAERHIPVVEQLVLALSVLVLVFGVTYVPEVIARFGGGNDQMSAIKSSDEKDAAAVVPVQTDPFANVRIEAESAIVIDAGSGEVLFNKNGDAELPLASVTKLMTALVSYELLSDTDSVAVTRESVSQEGDNGLLVGEQFSFLDLLDLTLVNSSNDGAYALASAAGGVLNGDEQLFVDAMNLRAQELGLSNTIFYNPTGLDISETQGGAYGSARDMATLIKYMITQYPDILENTAKAQVVVPDTVGNTHQATNTNQTVNTIEGIIASKTGYTELAGGNLIIAFDAGLGHPIIVSVLGSTYEGRFNDVLALAAAARTNILEQ